MILAQVIKSTGSWYLTKSSDGQIIQCRIVGKFRMDNLKLTNPVAVGDMVYIEMENETQGIIKEILFSVGDMVTEGSELLIFEAEKL